MSYYILPKNNNNIFVNPTCDNTDYKICISHSLYNYYNELLKQLQLICSNDTFSYSNNYEDIIKFMNPYDYIFSNVPGSKFSVSKLTPKTTLFYDFLEIIKSLNILDNYKNISIQSLHITPNYNDSIECIELFHEDYKEDNLLCFSKIDNDTHISIHNIKFNFMFFEAFYRNDNINNYILNLIEIFMIILNHQTVDGISIIKINETVHKPVIEFIYLLTSTFEKVYIIKPNTNNITSFEKYIVCKNFINDPYKLEVNKNNYRILQNSLKNIDHKNIISIINKELPYCFINKIDEINIIIGQQQLEALDQMINILKNKNKEEKIENIKKINIQKSIGWCEKFKIPCNKFSEKINIFLPIIKELSDSISENS